MLSLHHAHTARRWLAVDLALAGALALTLGCSPERVVDLLPRGDGGPGLADATTPDSGKVTASGPCKGYTLVGNPVTEGTGAATVLVDMNGKVVRQWVLHGFPAQMLPGGSVVGAAHMREGDIGMYQDAVELVRMDWSGATVWSYSDWDSDGTGKKMSRQHHDYQLSGNPVGFYAPGQVADPSGAVLILGHKRVSAPNIADEPLYDDVIYEVTATGQLTGFVWYASQHVDEMGFSAEERAAIRKRPNYDEDRGDADWLHINAMARLGRNKWYSKLKDDRFHPDNIIISSRHANLVAIIRRSDGRIVWRVGPTFEGKPWAGIGQFVGQHHAHMIPEGLPGAGHIMVYDNGGASGYGGAVHYPRFARTYSRVVEIDPVTYKVVWQYGTETGPDHFLSFAISSAQRLPNGNTLIVDGDGGYVFEVTAEKKKVWEFDSTRATGGYVYRAYRVPPEWLPGVNPGGYPDWKGTYPPRNSP